MQRGFKSAAPGTKSQPIHAPLPQATRELALQFTFFLNAQLGVALAFPVSSDDQSPGTQHNPHAAAGVNIRHSTAQGAVKRNRDGIMVWPQRAVRQVR